MIVVLGSINIDIRLDVDNLPRAGETIHARGRQYFGGGKGANQALAVKRAGVDVALVSAVGSDPWAQYALADLIAAGVSISDVAVTAEETGSANIYVDKRGENIIVVTAGANSLVDTKLAEAAVARAADGVIVLQQEIPTETTRTALILARKQGVRSILNVSPFDGQSTDLAKLADVVIANQHEWSQLSGSGDSSIEMREWSRHYRQTIIVTKGAEGVSVASPSEYFELAAPVIQPVDTVGAGDTFCGYLAASLIRGGSLRDAAKLAVAAASIACLRKGAQSSIPVLDDVAVISG